MKNKTEWNKTVFLAYAREDQMVVKSLYERLSDNGLFPWMDIKSQDAGTRWGTTVEDAIKKARFFIICLSSNSIKMDGFVKEELRIAFKVLEQKARDVIYFIPVLIEDIEVPDIVIGKIRLKDYNIKEIISERGLKNLINQLLDHINIDGNLEGDNKREIKNLPSIKVEDSGFVSFNTTIHGQNISGRDTN